MPARVVAAVALAAGRPVVSGVELSRIDWPPRFELFHSCRRPPWDLSLAMGRLEWEFGGQPHRERHRQSERSGFIPAERQAPTRARPAKVLSPEGPSFLFSEGVSR